jgi:MoaA/NifB/PqqE/SkfB family radical SAM enzyme
MPWSRFDRWFRPHLNWIQVEVTTDCDAHCSYCPRTTFAQSWQTRYMDDETFTELLPALPRTDLVFLQGWGEPLLHPRFLDLVRQVKQMGSPVGLSTNGNAVDEAYARDLVEAGVDVVAFSLAGVDDSQNRVRRGTRLEQVLTALRALDEERRRQGRERPALHVAYLLLRSRLTDLERLPGLLAGTGVCQVVVSTLDLVPTPDLAHEAIHPASMDEYAHLSARIEDVIEDARRHGIEMHAQLHRPGHRLACCSENVQRALFIGVDGSVAPCVFAALPVRDVTIVRAGEERPYRRRTFGDVHRSSLSSLWRSREFRRFRDSFDSGMVDDVCLGCPKRHVRLIGHDQSSSHE